MSRFEEQVCAKIRERAKVGKRKYGVTMERDDLNLHDWLTHLQEELMDAAVYVERLMEDVGILMTEMDVIINEARNRSND
mgnify:CR=1 FL=1|jgi:hypothetical protein|tara:strand:+ start:9602 stop:9841 length:240 start_codon:yes stop_codon:yes gene_type:complete